MTAWGTTDLAQADASFVAFSNGNLNVTALSGAANASGRADAGVASGEKKFFSVTFPQWIPGVTLGVGIANASQLFFNSGGQFLGNADGDSLGCYVGTGAVYVGGSQVATVEAATGSSDTISVAVDYINSRIWFRVNGGNWNNNASYDPVTNVGGIDFSSISGDVYPAYNITDSSGTLGSVAANFGATAFTFQPPSGFARFDALIGSGGASISWSTTQTILNYDFNFVAFSNNDLTATALSGASNAGGRAEVGVGIGEKRFFSVTFPQWSSSLGPGVGICNEAQQFYNSGGQFLGNLENNSLGYYTTGDVYLGATLIASLAPIGASDTVDVAIDRANNRVWFRVSGGNWNNNASYNPATNVGGIDIATIANGFNSIYPAYNTTDVGGTLISITANFGPSFNYPPPTGFSSLVPGGGSTTNFWSITQTFSNYDLNFVSFSNSNLTVTAKTGAQNAGGRANVGIQPGEKKFYSVTSAQWISSGIGICNSAQLFDNTGSQWIGNAEGRSLGYYNDGRVYIGATAAATIAAINTNDVIDVAIDCAHNRLWFRSNGGNWNNNASYDPATNVGGIDISTIAAGGVIYPAYDILDFSGTLGNITANFGGSAFAYAPPSGFSFFGTTPQGSAAGTSAVTGLTDSAGSGGTFIAVAAGRLEFIGGTLHIVDNRVASVNSGRLEFIGKVASVFSGGPFGSALGISSAVGAAITTGAGIIGVNSGRIEIIGGRARVVSNILVNVRSGVANFIGNVLDVGNGLLVGTSHGTSVVIGITNNTIKIRAGALAIVGKRPVVTGNPVIIPLAGTGIAVGGALILGVPREAVVIPNIYPLAFPTYTRLLDFTLREMNVVGMTTAPFSGIQQVQEFSGAWWEAEFTIRPLSKPLFDQWGAFFSSLGGKAGTFLMGDPMATSTSGLAGVVGGTPQIDGNSQKGSVLSIKTTLGNIPGYLRAGDKFSIGLGAARRMHKVLTDVNLVGGRAQLDIWPRLRYSPPNNDLVYFTNASTQWRMTVNTIQNTITGADGLYRIPTVAVIEAL